MIFKARFIIGRCSAKDLLKKESVYFHSINPGFDAKVAEKILNGISIDNVRVTSFSNNFSLFQLEKTTTIFTKMLVIHGFHSGNNFWKKKIVWKTCKFKPFCCLMKNVLLRRE